MNFICAFFCISNTTLLYLQYFYTGNTIGILTADNLLVVAYALSCLLSCVKLNFWLHAMCACTE